MIYALSGKINVIDKNFLVVETNGLSYQVFVTDFLLEKAKIGEPIKLFTYLQLREETIELYGFASQEELNYFKLLNAVVGIGPKTAVGVLSLISIKDLQKAILNGNINILTKISGIGKKTAERIILELKGKIEKLVKWEAAGDDTLIFDALISMGYTPAQVRTVFKKIPNDISETKQRIKEALKILSGK